MTNVALKVVAEPTAGTKAVIDRRSADTVLFKGSDSGITYICGSCHSPLIVGLDVKNFRDVVLKCNHCKAFNAVGITNQCTLTAAARQVFDATLLMNEAMYDDKSI